MEGVGPQQQDKGEGRDIVNTAVQKGMAWVSLSSDDLFVTCIHCYLRMDGV